MHGPLDVAAEGQDVAAFAHRDGEADRRLAVDPEHRLRRIGIAAVNLGDVAQPDQAAVRDKIDRQDVLLGLERARDADGSLSLPVCMVPAGLTISAPAARRSERTGRSPARELLNRELDEDLFILGAEDLDLRHVRHLQEPRANVLDIVPQLAMSEAVRGEAVDDSEGITELIVEARADDAGRQGVAHIGDAFADVIPDVGNLARRSSRPSA